MKLQQLPPEIIYLILYYLPSTDITTLASFCCRTIREWTLVLMNERAQQSMLQGWRLMIGATTIKTETGDSRTKYEKDREYLYAFQFIDSSTLDMSFSVGTFGKEGFGSLNLTAPSSSSVTTASPPPEQNQHDHQKLNQPRIPMQFGHTTTTIQVSILKEKVPTKLLEFAATLSDNYSFLVTADDYQSLEPNHILSLSAGVHPEFTINYCIQRLPPTDDHQDETAPMVTQQQQEAITDTPLTPPSPPATADVSKPDIVLSIESVKVSPKWWWTRIDHQRYSTFLGLEHQYW